MQSNFNKLPKLNRKTGRKILLAMYFRTKQNRRIRKVWKEIEFGIYPHTLAIESQIDTTWIAHNLKNR